MTLKQLEDHYRILRHEDPLSNESGAFPVGTGVGAMLGGAAAGAAAGAVAGPVGAIVGTIAGGVFGGYTGKMVSEYIDPTIDVEPLSVRVSTRSDSAATVAEKDSAGIHRFGWHAFDPTISFTEREAELERRLSDEYLLMRGSSRAWPDIKPVLRSGYGRDPAAGYFDE